MKENKNKHNFNEYDFGYSKDYINKPDVLGLVYFILSMVSLYLSLVLYLIALPISIILFVISVINHNQNNTISTNAAIITSSIAFLISLFILLVNFIIY